VTADYFNDLQVHYFSPFIYYERQHGAMGSASDL